MCSFCNTNNQIIIFVSGRWASRTPKGFNTSTVFKTGSVANRIDLPKVFNELQNLNDELYVVVLTLAKQCPHV